MQVGELMSILVSSSVRAVLEDGEWRPVTLAPEAVPDIDQSDLDALEDIVLRDRTPAEVTARSRRLLGLDAEEADEEVSVPALADFRGEPGGAAGGEDGEPLADEAVVPAGAGG